MKLIIAGSRHYSSAFDIVKLAFDFIPELRAAYAADEITEVVSGTAEGIDKGGERWARNAKCKMDGQGPLVVRFPPDWEKLGKAAGPVRNRQMAEYGDALLLIWDGESAGSKNMKLQMEKLGKPIYEVVFRGPKKY